MLTALVLAVAVTAQSPAQNDPPRADVDPFRGAWSPTRLLLVTPQKFAARLQPLLEHKNKTGMPAFLVTVEALTTSLPGHDHAERIKRGIARAHEQLGVRYVLLVGDPSVLPVRFRKVRQVPADAPHDGTFNPSDLYYANLYRAHVPGEVAADPTAIRHHRQFDTWDLDGNGIYNEQHWQDDAVTFNPDHVDGCPDIALARLPAHTAEEVQVYADKVVRYETGSMDEAWCRRCAFVADQHYGGANDICDGLAAAMAHAGALHQDGSVRLLLNCDATDQVAEPWLRGDFDAVDAAASRCWWMTYLGHAGPRYWAVYEHGRGYDDGRVSKLANQKALPIVYCIGCESGMFATWQPCERYRDQLGRFHEFVWHAEQEEWQDRATGQRLGARLVVPQPDGYDLPANGDRTFACSWLLRPGAGGAIAYFGQLLVCEPDKGADLLRAMSERFDAGDRILGDLWGNAQRVYWLANRGNEGVFRSPRIYLGIMQLFGDPSLRLPQALH